MKIKFLLLVTGLLSLTTIIAQVYPVRPQLSDKNSFSMILLPDPQSYNKFDANHCSSYKQPGSPTVSDH